MDHLEVEQLDQLTIDSVKSLAQSQPGLTESSIRWDLHRDGDELVAFGAVFRNGRRVLIDRYKYLQWLKSGNSKRVA